MIVGVAIWVALHESGIDPVIAGLAVGLVTSAYPPARRDLERVTEVARSFREQPTPELARAAQLSVASAISANERLQYRLHPWTSFVIVPLFALANAGIHIDGQLLERRRHLPDHAGDPVRLRGRQAGRHRRRHVAGVAARADAPGAQLADDRRRRSHRRHRLHGRAADLEPRVRGTAAGGGEARHLRRGHRVGAAGLRDIPADRTAAQHGCARASSPARRTSSSTSPTTSTPSATTSAARTMRRSRCSSTATTNARTAGAPRSSCASCSTRSATTCATCGGACR